jgi:cell division protein ZapE
MVCQSRDFSMNAIKSGMTPQQRYQQDLENQLIVPDAAQQHAVTYLQALFRELTETETSVEAGISHKIRKLFTQKEPRRIQGIYLWGGVGRGKTYLMDILYDCLPFEAKLRTHFHRFMQQVHADLTEAKGNKNPLSLVADKLAGKARVVCFDEFFVSDIGDAMILAGLLGELFERGVVLVTTSNIEPDLLYSDGLQRERFLPAIEYLKNHTRVVELDGGTDYRLRSLAQAKLYHWPLERAGVALLEQSFQRLAPDYEEAIEGEVIDVLGRSIVSRFSADDVIWFDFEQLCGGPRNAYDYVEIAKIYHAVLLGEVPQMDENNNDQARRFINLIDELYDRNVKLIMTAAVPAQELYVGMRLIKEYQRTVSRLLEMQSHEYLSRAHRP